MDAVDQPLSLSTAKTHMAGLVQAAETGEVVHISRHGKPFSVLISEQAYALLQGHQFRRGMWTVIADWRAAAHGSRLAQPLLIQSCDGLELRILVQEGAAALEGGRRDPGISERKSLFSFDLRSLQQ